jgi:citrate lyase subunit beta/citryl-CoA lyase
MSTAMEAAPTVAGEARITGIRSWLYAPGDSEKLVRRVFDVGADAVVLDLEDGVPADRKSRARGLVAEALGERAGWVRINPPRTPEAEADLRAVAELTQGIRVPKIELPDDVAWVRERAQQLPLSCILETARGVLAAPAIAAARGVASLVLGLADLLAQLGATAASETVSYARGQLVLASGAAAIAAPIDSVYLGPDDEQEFRREAEHARAAGFFGKSAVRPWQVPILNEVFAPTPDELSWARQVLERFETAGGAATRLESGELIDLPVAERARALLRSAS